MFYYMQKENGYKQGGLMMIQRQLWLTLFFYQLV